MNFLPSYCFEESLAARFVSSEGLCSIRAEQKALFGWFCLVRLFGFGDSGGWGDQGHRFRAPKGLVCRHRGRAVPAITPRD
jgi:hypothetical protein